MGQATGPQLLGSVVRSYGYRAAFITAGLGLFGVAAISRGLFAHARRSATA
jgi:hypothetical protein